jgi:hypothetical protein
MENIITARLTEILLTLKKAYIGHCVKTIPFSTLTCDDNQDQRGRPAQHPAETNSEAQPGHI